VSHYIEEGYMFWGGDDYPTTAMVQELILWVCFRRAGGRPGLYIYMHDSFQPLSPLNARAHCHLQSSLPGSRNIRIPYPIFFRFIVTITKKWAAERVEDGERRYRDITEHAALH
jgi:hypothetical protein